MVVGIIIIVLLLLFTGFVIVKETNQQLFWRSLVAKGDVEAIKQIIEIEVEHWHESRVPKGTPALLWHGIQTVELTDVTPKGARVNCSAEGEYALVAGQRVESSSPLAEGMKITMKLAEMLLYDVPNVKLDHVQIDVYTSFRDEEGRAQPRCILSTDVERRAVEHIDWEETAPADFIKLTQARFGAGATDRLQPVEPIAWA
ncbi:MAG TPA: hypothetical protein VI759_00025 [Dehalococcoidia bacterium]|nr:hypothetical protein [Dehalococcoidia bacterium]